MRTFFLSILALTALPLRAAEDLVPDYSRGRELYMNYCVACHGENGDGQGPAARAISKGSKPRNFLIDEFKNGRTAEAVYETISNGLAGTAMPPWNGALTVDERKALADYVLSLRKR